ncbi:AMP-binding protein, partial [Bacillus altitudinis]|uniref:AMP-binding protein n=1 Tax=Bacillus altitudinis TaxID=293387 RepID=UPI00307DBD16
MILFTSATTRNPKPCILPHPPIYQFLTTPPNPPFHLKRKPYFPTHPLYHISSINHLIPPPIQRYTLLFLHHPTPKPILQTIHKQTITFI